MKPSIHHGRPLFLVSPSLPILVLSEKLRHMSGGYRCTSIPGISVGGNAITSQVVIVNIIGTHFTSVVISDNHNTSFKLLKETTETLPLNFAKGINLHALVLVYICRFVPLCDYYNICAAFRWAIILSATLYLYRRSTLCLG
jgi:hypothetical protein